MALGLSIVQQEKLNDAMQGYHALFKQTKGKPSTARQKVDKLTMFVSSTGAIEIYNFLDAVPSMKLWTGERRAKKLKANGFSVINEDYEGTISISSNDIDDDRLGIYRPRIVGLANGYPKLLLRLLKELINSGFVTTGPGGACYDGRSFFATNHKNGKGSVSNKLTAALSSTSFNAAMLLLKTMTDEENEPLNYGDDRETVILGIPAELEATAVSIVGVKTLPAGGDNPDYLRAQIMVIPGMDSTKWFVAEVGVDEQKPFIFQERQALRPSDNRTGDGAFNTKNILFGADARCATAYANWQTAVGSDGTT